MFNVAERCHSLQSFREPSVFTMIHNDGKANWSKLPSTILDDSGKPSPSYRHLATSSNAVERLRRRMGNLS